MRREDLLKLPSMPAAGPSYPAGPYRFVDREFLVITYETDPELIRAGLPEPLEPIEQPISRVRGRHVESQDDLRHRRAPGGR